MTDDPENLVLVFLRRIDKRLDGLDAKLTDVIHRTGALELGIAGLRRDYGAIGEAVAHLADRLDRIERRLDHGPPA